MNSFSLFRTLTFFLIAGALLLSQGCDKYLSVMPDDRTRIDSREKLELLLASAYNVTPHYAFTEPMTDNATDGGKINRFNQINDLSYKWGVNDLDEDEDSPLYFWVGCYQAIAVANQVLASIREMGDLPEHRAAKGEALLIRAYNHFMLVNLWAKPYNPQTAESDFGIPYVLEPEEEPFKKYARNTVAEVYAYIEQDLLEGLTYAVRDYVAPKYRFTPEAGKAFATRFYLYRGEAADWERVIAYASELLTSPLHQIRDWTGGYSRLGPNDMEFIYSAPEEPANILVAASPSYYNRYYAGSPGRFTMTPELIYSIFSPAANPFGTSWAYEYFQYEIGGTQFVPKFNEHFIFSNAAANIGNGYLQHVLFAYDEVFLNRIEAYAMLDNFDAATADLGIYFERKLHGYSRNAQPVTNELIVSTYGSADGEFSPHYGLTEQQCAYVKCVAELRRREYLHEGLRWFDIRRLNIPVRHDIIPQETLVLAPDDSKRVMQIPATAQESGLKPNVR